MIDEAVFARATQWWSLQREGPLSEHERGALLSWLRESPRHVEAYLTVAAAADGLARACRAWTESDALLIEKAAADHGADVVALSRTQDRSPRAPARRLAWRMPLVAAALAVIGICAGWLLRGQLFDSPQTFRTAHAEQGSWRLPDGSVLHLNSESTVVVRYSSAERLVIVERGQAMFQVAKDASRRFRADAGDAQVVALGTEFDVDRHTGHTAVAVLEGRVAVIPGSATALSGPPTLSIANATTVKAGEQLDVGERGAVPKPIDIESVRAWTRRQIVFDDLPLGSVVDEFNRYAQVPLEIVDEPLKSIPVSGVLSGYDIDSFVAFLNNIDGVEVQRGPSRIQILLRPGRGVTRSSPRSEEAGTTHSAGPR